MKLEKKKINNKTKAGVAEINPTPKTVRVVCGIISTLIALSAVIPLLLVLSASLTDNTTLVVDGYSLIPPKFSTAAYEYVFSNAQQVWRSYGVTIFITVVGTILGLTIKTLFAYGLSRPYFPWAKQFNYFIYFTMLFHGGMVPTYIVMTNIFHLADSYFAMILPMAVNTMHLFILRTYMKTSIPHSVVESAKIDGAGEWMCYYKIVLPMAVPSIAVIMLFTSVAYWNDWYQAFLYISSDKKMPIQLLLKRIENDIQFLANSTEGGNYEEMERMRELLPTESFRMALVMMVVTPIMVAYPFFQKFFIKGMTVGAVKG